MEKCLFYFNVLFVDLDMNAYETYADTLMK